MALEREQFNWQKQQAAAEQARITKSSGSGSSSSGSSSKDSISKDNNSVKKSDGWITAREMANSLGLPAVVDLSKVVSDKEYEKKVVNGSAYYRKK